MSSTVARRGHGTLGSHHTPGFKARVALEASAGEDGGKDRSAPRREHRATPRANLFTIPSKLCSPSRRSADGARFFVD
jgi:hypothetical protein